MKLSRYLAAFGALFAAFAAPLLGQTDYDDDFWDMGMDAIDERDSQAMKQFLRGKRGMMLEEKLSNFNISGDIRAEYKYVDESHTVFGDKVDLRGECISVISDKLGLPYSQSDDADHKAFGKNVYEIEFNLYLDYITERTWARVWLEFDNRMGVVDTCKFIDSENYQKWGTGTQGKRVPCSSGSCNDICLREAYFGVHAYQSGFSVVDIQFGRRPFYKIFDSRVQFNNTMDGGLLTWYDSIEGIGDCSIAAGLYVVDSVSNHLGYIVEGSWTNIGEYGVGLRYSYNDYACGDTRYCVSSSQPDSGRLYEVCRFLNRFRISQFTINFETVPDVCLARLNVYGAFLINHAAERITWESSGRESREKMAWYAGAMLGSIEREGDWAVDFNWQSVGAQAVHQSDLSGIGRGNAFGICMIPGTAHERFGNTNYQGLQIEGLYAVTDNFTVGLEFEWTWELNADIGGKHEYRKFEVEFGYGW